VVLGIIPTPYFIIDYYAENTREFHEKTLDIVEMAQLNPYILCFYTQKGPILMYKSF